MFESTSHGLNIADTGIALSDAGSIITTNPEFIQVFCPRRCGKRLRAGSPGAFLF